MFKYFSHRLSIIIKLLFVVAGFSAAIYLTIYSIYHTFIDYLFNNHNIQFSFSNITHLLPIQPLIISLLIVFILIIFITLDLIFFVTKINDQIKESLDDRKLTEQFSQFYSSMTFFGILKNLKSLLSLYKSFDNMKTARIVLESSTIKQLMNSVSEGLILVNKELIVTHINHVSEHDLGLIPGEIIGQAMSRKINNEILIQSLEKVFEFDHKYLDLDIKQYDLLVSIYPLKDKFGDIIRALVIFNKTSASSGLAKNNLNSPKSTKQ
tara:strand:+ start:377 stop:1174 length:798 start_codon:yes stop_codon:yes gene_type:complete